ncbi:putative alpha/beta superfamily hydrolase [Paenibacillus anaericanus]|uniref:alpha/beta hydrolase n=1 Tax=Paenibacillus anaericanus TaxID=170367 RepID=UPI00277E20D3|nr:alpha/beta hydrolase-fold protein [Paenibacillus anaericanus]MDQ0089370.1 putative alpha/beta superfamily hydrolase [Paenibacillus anaericanus]
MNQSNLTGRILHVGPIKSEYLQNERGITVYLPPNYDTQSNKGYPVLYLHDGQGLFEPNPFSGISWRIHETTDRLVSQGLMKEIIIVGIHNRGSERLHEYTHPIDKLGIQGAPDIETRGELYERFIIDELKPYIDNTFSTIPDREHTALMGSSLGGLVTYNIGLRNPEIFSKLAILSPFFIRLNLNSLQEVIFYKHYPEVDKANLSLWIDIGENESNILVQHVRKVVDQLIDDGFVPGQNLMYYEVPNGAHTERDWAQRVHAPLLYFFGTIGHPVSNHLYGRKELGLTGMEVKTNAVVTYDSGFVMTDLSGIYHVDHHDILEIKPNGTLIPQQTGKTEVSYAYNGADSAVGRYNIIPHLNEQVQLSLLITVPYKMHSVDTLFVDKLAVPRLSDCSYGGTFTLPRDIGMQFRIKVQDGNQETFRSQDPNYYRILKVDQDMAVKYFVEAWENDIST